MCARGETGDIIKNLTPRRNRLRRNKIAAFSYHTVRPIILISCQLAHCCAKCRTFMMILTHPNDISRLRLRTIQRIN
ncbi:hypothetical protein I5504_18050 [Citrobacter koseri]|uniref:hypothetical protein n=1 Tax=unclassified Citrobacter TaxID=2644389 RepID=UPI000E206729|nr:MULTISPECIES: hypothetical protein [Citrobacter]EKW5655428.1 hypothetical protein [Citrobacter koseri]EKY0738390.1 hypothetical protein [Citrobacter koseri]ELJ2663027.1 hypothetical protein [Citrobacter koseri]MBJ8671620.1 hypothetical protein [Citrobacter koseri]MBJ8763467.1 hypothetical protein [Citrobacter koseri]